MYLANDWLCAAIIASVQFTIDVSYLLKFYNSIKLTVMSHTLVFMLFLYAPNAEIINNILSNKYYFKYIFNK